MKDIPLSEINNLPPFARTYAPSHELVDSECLVGVELEFESHEGHRWSSHMSDSDEISELWETGQDGSLRNNGLELRTPHTLFGQDLVNALKVAIEYIPRRYPRYDISELCGLHVHLDVRGLTTNQLLAISCATAIAEPAIYAYVGKTRAQNIYCLPLEASDALYQYFSYLKYGMNSEKLRNGLERMNKYNGYNTLPILSQGSVEFRYHAMTLDYDELITWLNFLLTLRKTAMGILPEDITDMSYGDFCNIFLPPGFSMTPMGWYYGKVIAKDLLNFTELAETWKEKKDRYGNTDNLNFKVKEKGEATRRPMWEATSIEFDTEVAPPNPYRGRSDPFLQEFSVTDNPLSEADLERARETINELRGRR